MAKQALATEEDREQAELLRFRIRNLGKWLEALKANHTAVILAEDKVPEMEERYLRWRSSASLRAAPRTKWRRSSKVQPARDACIRSRMQSAEPKSPSRCIEPWRFLIIPRSPKSLDELQRKRNYNSRSTRLALNCVKSMVPRRRFSTLGSRQGRNMMMLFSLNNGTPAERRTGRQILARGIATWTASITT